MQRPMLLLCGLALLCTGAGNEPGPPSDEAGLLGRKIVDLTLDDFRGKSHALPQYTDAPAIVACFLGTECPLSKMYGPRLQTLADRFAPQGVVFLGIDSNVQDSMTELAAYARAHSITSCFLFTGK